MIIILMAILDYFYFLLKLSVFIHNLSHLNLNIFLIEVDSVNFFFHIINLFLDYRSQILKLFSIFIG